MLTLVYVFASLAVSRAIAQSCSLDADGKAEHVDVLILGAGITGIAAARTLEVNGISNFLVLEASDRIGGRIREYDGTSIEVGANWIHGLDPEDPEHHPIWREWVECDEDGPDGSITPELTRVYDAAGNRCDTKEEYVRKTNAFYSALDMLEELEPTIDTSVRQGLTMSGWELEDSLDNFIEWELIDLCIGVKPQNLSLIIYSQQTTESEEEGEDYLVVDEKGYSFVVQCMARNFKEKVRLNSHVKKIQMADDCVCATVDSEVYCGSYGIVTFSMGVLQAAVGGGENSVEFEPALPQWKQDAINRATLVFYGKVFMIFNTTFWEETDDDQQILGYIADERGYYGYYVLDKNRPHTITVDIVDDLALRVARQEEEETVNEIMTILRKIFSDDIPEPHTAIISKWPTDPLFLSSYTAYGPGVPTSIFEDLLKPVNDRLYFAGEAMNSTDYGYTQGGYGSGVNVAKQISTMLSSNGQDSNTSSAKMLMDGVSLVIVVNWLFQYLQLQ